MNLRNSLFTLVMTVASLPLAAQTAAEAKKLYEQGAYAEAMPGMERLVKSQPANGNYNLWYGVCCMETGKAEQAVKHLEEAVKRRIPGGQFQLARCYDRLYRFEEAVETLDNYIGELTRRKRDTAPAEELMEQVKVHLRMLKGVERVCVVDSFVVDKTDFLTRYRLSNESGKLYHYRDYFPANGREGGTVYETELANRIYFSEKQENGTLDILCANRQQGEWGIPAPLPATINEGHNADYPYVMTDGVTIYYAADGEGSLGGYDLFVTRYNPSTESYLAPENIGMPFNSVYNDYMLAIDEFNDLGWFASDRYQPEGKVCIYVFVPHSTKQVYDYESTDPAQLAQLARLTRIRDTWGQQDEVEEGRQRLAQLALPKEQHKFSADFIFRVDDRHLYHHIEEFRAPQSAQLFKAYQQSQEALQQLEERLEKLRLRYGKVSTGEKEGLTDAILDLEQRVDQLTRQAAREANEIRRIEQETIK